MNPVIGLDVAKGESQVQAFLQKKETYRESFKFTHDLPGLHTFHRFYQEVEKFQVSLRLLSLNPLDTIMSQYFNFLKITI